MEPPRLNRIMILTLACREDRRMMHEEREKKKSKTKTKTKTSKQTERKEKN